MYLRGKGVHSWCDGSSDRSFMGWTQRARCSSVVRAVAHGAMGRRIDPSWCGPRERDVAPW